MVQLRLFFIVILSSERPNLKKSVFKDEAVKTETHPAAASLEKWLRFAAHHSFNLRFGDKSEIDRLKAIQCRPGNYFRTAPSRFVENNLNENHFYRIEISEYT